MIAKGTLLLVFEIDGRNPGSLFATPWRTVLSMGKFGHLHSQKDIVWMWIKVGSTFSMFAGVFGFEFPRP